MTKDLLSDQERVPLLSVASIGTLYGLFNMNNWTERSANGVFNGGGETSSWSYLTSNYGCGKVTLWMNFGVIVKVEDPYV